MSTTSATVPAAPGSTDRLLTPAFVRLAVADLAYYTATGVTIYALPLYVTGPVGSDRAGAGLAFGAFAVSALLMRPVAGRVSDVHGRRPLLLAGALLSAAALALTAVAGSLPLVVALRLVLGVAEAAFFVASFAALADLAPPSRMGEALSYNSIGLYLGLALGPPLGEAIVSGHGFRAGWLAATVLALLAALAVHLMGETRPAAAPVGGSRHLFHRPALAPGIGFLTSIIAMGGFLTFAALHADDVGLAATSLPLLVYGGVVVVCRLAFAKIPDRLPPLSLGAAALAAIASGLMVASVWDSPLGLVAGAAVLAAGVAFSTPAFFSAIFATARPAERGAASGTASAFIDLGLGGGPMLLGYVAQSAGVPWAFATAATVAGCGSAWTLRLRRHGA